MKENLNEITNSIEKMSIDEYATRNDDEIIHKTEVNNIKNMKIVEAIKYRLEKKHFTCMPMEICREEYGGNSFSDRLFLVLENEKGQKYCFSISAVQQEHIVTDLISTPELVTGIKEGKPMEKDIQLNDVVNVISVTKTKNQHLSRNYNYLLERKGETGRVVRIEKSNEDDDITYIVRFDRKLQEVYNINTFFANEIEVVVKSDRPNKFSVSDDITIQESKKDKKRKARIGQMNIDDNGKIMYDVFFEPNGYMGYSEEELMKIVVKEKKK